MGNFAGGFFCGILFLFIFLLNVPAGKIHNYDVAIEQCEKELPRNQKCKISATIVKQ